MKKYLVLLLAVILAACSSKNEESLESLADYESNYIPKYVTGIIDDVKNIDGILDNANHINDQQSLIGISDFMEDRAWVQYDMFNTKTALINKEGEILWETDENVTMASEIRDGFAYCKIERDEYDTYIILDSDGNVTLTKDCSKNYMILSHGDGWFLVTEHILSFDTNEWQIGAIDEKGNTVIPLKSYETSVPLGSSPDWYSSRKINFDNIYSYECDYVGDNIYDLLIVTQDVGNYYNKGLSVLLNIENQSIIYTKDNLVDSSIYMDRWSDFENGLATVFVKDLQQDLGSICALSSDGSLTQIVENEEWSNSLLEKIFSLNPLSDGLLCINDEYYNLNGECVIDFPKYKDKYRYSCGDFENGYALMNIVGADKNNYITVIDKTGTFMFEPITGFGKAVWNNDQYLISGTEDCITIFDINGIKLYSIECKCISNITGRDVVFSNGMFGFFDFYLNLETGTVIGNHKDGITITAY